MEESGIYDDPGTRGDQPTTESSRPEGGGAVSGNSAGGNKPDPVSVGPQLGSTIAGRQPDSITDGTVGNEAVGTQLTPHTDIPEGRDNSQTGGPDTGGAGVTGSHGSSPSAAHDTPDTDTGSGNDESSVVTSPK